MTIDKVNGVTFTLQPSKGLSSRKCTLLQNHQLVPLWVIAKSNQTSLENSKQTSQFFSRGKPKMLCQQEQQRWWQNAASKGVRLDREGGAMLSTGSLRRRAIWETARKKWSRMDLKTSLKWISALLPRNKGPISCWAWPSGSRQSPWTQLCRGS